MPRFYRRTPHRLPADAYRGPGYFLITVVVHARRPLLGRLEAGQVVLSRSGEVVRDCLLEIPRHYPAIRVDEWVVMPDHLHVILDVHRPLPAGLPQAIGGFKAATTRRLNVTSHRTLPSIWQKGFHDRRLSDAAALSAARLYVRSNPSRA